MKSYTRYLQLLQDFQFRAINPLKNMGANDNYRFGNVEELNPLKQFIMTELKAATMGNVKLKLKKLREINVLFIKFDKNYPKLFEKSKAGALTLDDLGKPFVINLNSPFPDSNVTPEFIKNLYQSILFRQKSLLDLINQTEDLLADTAQRQISPARLSIPDAVPGKVP